MIMNKIIILLSILFISGLFCSCERPEKWNMLYTRKRVERTRIDHTMSDGFLAKGTPAFAGDENEPGDRLGIPFVNGFGRKLLVQVY